MYSKFIPLVIENCQNHECKSINWQIQRLHRLVVRVDISFVVHSSSKHEVQRSRCFGAEKFSRFKMIGFWQNSYSEMSRGVVFLAWSNDLNSTMIDHLLKRNRINGKERRVRLRTSLPRSSHDDSPKIGRSTRRRQTFSISRMSVGLSVYWHSQSARRIEEEASRILCFH